jgi:hypothetical protein
VTDDGATGRVVDVRQRDGGLFDYEFVYTVSPSGEDPTDLFMQLECFEVAEDDIDATDPPAPQPSTAVRRVCGTNPRRGRGRRRPDRPDIFAGLADG